MTDPVLTAHRLSKVYRVYGSSWDRLREAVLRRPRHRAFHALDDVSFTLAAGESLGVIGENGAGKSTLLKILAGVVRPSTGSLDRRGRVASILELGSGFHPDLTGRQNIAVNAAILGLTQAEIEARTPQIIAWSELESFIDQPVKVYSTGMAMRLGFAIATTVDPDILIIDEALSVGDGYFQKKCVDRLLALVAEGRSLLFCSHAMYYVTAFCQRALWLRGGRIEGHGPAQQVVEEYERFLLSKAAATTSNGPPDQVPAAAVEPEGAAPAPARITAWRLDRADGSYEQGGRWQLEVAWESDDRELAFHLGVGVNRLDDVEVVGFATHQDDLPSFRGQRRYELRLTLPALPIVKGEFNLYLYLLDEAGLHVHDQKIVRSAFRVASPTYRFGIVSVEHRWESVGVPAGVAVAPVA